MVVGLLIIPVSATTSIINRHLALNGVEVFPVTVTFMCERYLDLGLHNGLPTCAGGMAEVSNFMGSIGMNKVYYSTGTDTDFANLAIPIYAAKGKWFTVMTNSGNGGNDLWSATFNSIIKNNPYFLGYELQTEERSLYGQTDEALITRYNYLKSGDPNHVVFYFDSLYYNTDKSHNVGQFADFFIVSTFDHFKYSPQLWPLEDFLFVRESQLIERPPYFTRLDDKPIPFGMNVEQFGTIAVEGSKTFYPTSKRQLRAQVYWSITTNTSGINIWNYKGLKVYYSANGTVTNSTIAAYTNQIAGELTDPWMQKVLLSPTLNYSWNHEVPDNRVTFSKTACKSLSVYSGYCRSSFSYILKKINGEYILIIPNKNNNRITDVQITIKGLTGDMTATTYSAYNTEDSSNNGRRIPVHNGIFTDTFDGYAAHVYRIIADVPGGIVFPRYDVNEDGVVDVNDLILVGQYLNKLVPLNYPRTDVNMDGQVNILDISIVAQHFGK